MDINILKDCKYDKMWDSDERFIFRLSFEYLYGEFSPEHKPQLENYWKEATDLQSYYRLILNDESMENTQLYAKVSFKCDDMNHWYRVRGMASKGVVYKTISDAGSVKVKIGNTSILIPNGHGDGITRVVDFSDINNFNDHMFTRGSLVTLEGKFSICDYDCGSDEIVELDGKYSVWVYEGIVFFVKF